MRANRRSGALRPVPSVRTSARRLVSWASSRQSCATSSARSSGISFGSIPPVNAEVAGLVRSIVANASSIEPSPAPPRKAAWMQALRRASAWSAVSPGASPSTSAPRSTRRRSSLPCSAPPCRVMPPECRLHEASGFGTPHHPACLTHPHPEDEVAHEVKARIPAARRFEHRPPHQAAGSDDGLDQAKRLTGRVLERPDRVADPSFVVDEVVARDRRPLHPDRPTRARAGRPRLARADRRRTGSRARPPGRAHIRDSASEPGPCCSWREIPEALGRIARLVLREGASGVPSVEPSSITSSSRSR